MFRFEDKSKDEKEYKGKTTMKPDRNFDVSEDISIPFNRASRALPVVIYTR